MIRLDSSYVRMFQTVSALVAANADSTPTAVLYRNGSASGVSVTITNVTTGRYKATFSTLGTDDGWAKTDVLDLWIVATIGGTSYEAPVWSSEGDADAVMRGTDDANTVAPTSTLMQSTTIATLTSQTVFTLTAGSADNNAYKDALIVITDSATATQKARGEISAYTGGTLTVTLYEAPAFTIAAGDTVEIFAEPNYRLRQVQTQVVAAVAASVAASGIESTITGMPTFLRKGDARTVENGGAIYIRLYDSEDPPNLLTGLGSLDFADATITLCLTRDACGTSTVEATIPCSWGTSGDDGWVLVDYDESALVDTTADTMVAHKWGLKFQWGTDHARTPVYGEIQIYDEITPTQA